MHEIRTMLHVRAALRANILSPVMRRLQAPVMHVLSSHFCCFR